MESTRRLTIAIGQDAAERLTDLARAERRDPREQAALLLEEALARLSRERLTVSPTVVVVEGEKTAEAPLATGVQAVGTATGASGTPGTDA